MRDDGDIRLIVRLKNNRLVQFREDRGLTQKDMAELCGMGQSEYGAIENMKEFPVSRRTGEWSEKAMNIASVIGEPEEFLFPEAFRQIERTRIEKVVPWGFVLPGKKEVLRLAGRQPEPEFDLSSKERRKWVLKLIRTLPSKRTQRVVFLRFFRGMTAEEIGVRIGPSKFAIETVRKYPGSYNWSDKSGPCKARVDQIIRKGLRQMRNPARLSKFRKELWSEGYRTGPRDPFV